jgi:hypothetical protein
MPQSPAELAFEPSLSRFVGPSVTAAVSVTRVADHKIESASRSSA